MAGQKKERRLASPLSCRSVGTPLTVDCRSAEAFPSSPGIDLLCRSTPVTDLLRPFFFIDVSTRRCVASISRDRVSLSSHP